MTPARTLLAATAALAVSACMSNQAGDVAAVGFGDLSHPLPAHERAAADQVARCGDGAPTPEGSTWLRRSPYLQSTTERSVSVLWTETSAAPSTVRVTTPEGEAVTEAQATVDWDGLPDGARQMRARVEGLEPGTLYCYELAGEAGALTARAGLRTAPAAGGGAPVTFVALSDSGSGSEDQLAVLEQIETVPFDLLVHMGDVDQHSGTLAGYEDNFFAPYAGLLADIPAFPTPGNHDYQTDGGKVFRRVFALPDNGGAGHEEHWYSYDWGPVHFVAFNTEESSPAQLAWLEADLAATRKPWKIAYGHRPAYSSGDHGSQSDVRAAFGPLFEKYGVALVLAGHDHDYERTTPQGGVTYVVAGGGGMGTRAVGHSSFTAFSEQVLHFVYVTVEGDTLTLRAIDATGALFDSAVIRRPAAPPVS